MAKRMTARAVRLNCPKCLAVFSVVAFISQRVDREQFYKERAAQHDCAEHAKKLATSGTGIKNPLKASKAAAKSR
ncbi:MAG: hypothetical protein HY314_11730 [Acidobacteria bacterium]|nr:hypothetical protein [Acidobacteriota bacterium]